MVYSLSHCNLCDVGMTPVYIPDPLLARPIYTPACVLHQMQYWSAVVVFLEP